MVEAGRARLAELTIELAGRGEVQGPDGAHVHVRPSGSSAHRNAAMTLRSVASCIEVTGVAPARQRGDLVLPLCTGGRRTLSPQVVLVR